MTHPLIRSAGLLLCGLVAAPPASAAPLWPPVVATVPCAIVLVGHNFAATQADPYGQFTVVLRDGWNNPLAGATVTVDFSACCPDIRLSNTQLGAGITHAPNSASVSAITDLTGTAVFRIEGAASARSPLAGPAGCANIIATPVGGTPIVLTDGNSHAPVLVAVPDLDGAGGGTAGVAVGDLSLWISDKSAYALNNANYRQRSDFDFHLPMFDCIPIATGGNGISVADLAQWVAIKNSGASFSNGPFPANCP